MRTKCPGDASVQNSGWRPVSRNGCRPGRRIGRLALHQRAEIEARVGIGHRHRRQQRLGVGMQRVAEQLARRRQLDQAAGAHHGDAVGDVVDHGEVVRDEQVGEAELLLQVLQQIEDLRLDRHVERRHRLVADHHVGPQRQRAGDADPLALAAGEGVRVAAEMAAVEPDHLHQLAHHLAAIGVVADIMDHQRLDQDVVDGHARIERAERVLEDELQLGAEAVELAAVERQHVDLAAPVVEHDAAGCPRWDRPRCRASGSC